MKKRAPASRAGRGHRSRAAGPTRAHVDAPPRAFLLPHALTFPPASTRNRGCRKPHPSHPRKPPVPVPPNNRADMHRIASLGDMQESNKHERHHIAHGGARKQSTLWDSDDEQHAAMVDLGKVFEFVLKNTIVALVAAVWQSVAGLYYLAREGDYDALWEPATEMFHGTD